MSDFDDMVKDLRQKRDELRLQIHLASREAREEWEELEEKMEDFSSQSQEIFERCWSERNRRGSR